MSPTPKSDVVRGIDRIQSSVVPLLKSSGFRKHGRSFNRSNDGLVHVLTFQAGQYVRTSYGEFTVELGVFIPEVYALDGGQPPPKFLQDYHCEIRAGLPQLAFGNDNWWSATNDVETTAAEFPSLFENFVLPFFGRFASRQDILAEWKELGELPFKTAGRSSVAAAMILLHQGNQRDAIAALQNALAVSADHHLFQERVRSIAADLSLKL